MAEAYWLWLWLAVLAGLDEPVAATCEPADCDEPSRANFLASLGSISP